MFNSDLTKYLATLSKISFKECEEENITKQMHDIIALIDKVKSFTGDVKMNSCKSIKYENLRDDTINSTCDKEEAISNAKCVKDDCVVVPKIIC